MPYSKGLGLGLGLVGCPQKAFQKWPFSVRAYQICLKRSEDSVREVAGDIGPPFLHIFLGETFLPDTLNVK